MNYTPPPIAPNVLSNDPATPYNISPQARNLVRNMRLLSIIPWLMECELADVIDLWWYAKSIQPPQPPKQEA